MEKIIEPKVKTEKLLLNCTYQGQNAVNVKIEQNGLSVPSSLTPTNILSMIPSPLIVPIIATIVSFSKTFTMKVF